MSRLAVPSRRHPLVALLVLASLAVACEPGGGATPAATSADGGPSTAPQAVAGPTATRVPAAAATPAAATTPAGPATPSPTPPTSPTPAATEAPPPSPDAERAPEPFEMNLATADDFVAQYTFEWCVGASLQMAVNMSTDEHRDSRRDQQRLWEMARDTSFSPFGGANPRGWTQTLNDIGIGPYELVSLQTFDEALTVAAEAIRATDRPVGLVMWRGRHAWVMSGFESSDDPREADTFDVTGVRVHDPLYPHGSSVWGRSPRPNSLVSPATLAKQFVLRDSTRVNLGVPPGFLLILPVADEA